MQPPPHLTPDAAQAWADIIGSVNDRVTLTQADAPLLEVAAQQMATMRDAAARVHPRHMDSFPSDVDGRIPGNHRAPAR